MGKKLCLGLLLFICCLTIHAQQVNSDTYAIGVTPEDFGCKGDSITDDTENLQKAIDFCKTNNRLLRSSKGKIYAVSYPLDIINPGEMQIDFGGAEIKAVQEMACIINYDNGKDFNIRHNNIINNLLLDCNHLSGGIHCSACIKTSFNFMMIRNCVSKAFEVLDGYEVFLTNSHIHCDNNSDTYGIYTKTGDSHFDNVVIIDAHTAVYQECAGVNFYDKIHAWLFNKIEGSIFFDVAGGMVLLNQGYCDTAEKGYYMHKFATIKMMNCQYYNNPDCYDSPNNPVIFAFANEELSKIANVSCISSCFNSGGLKVNLCNYPTQRIQFNQCFIDPSIIGNKGTFSIKNANGITFNSSKGEIIDDNLDFMCPDKDKGNHLYIDANITNPNKKDKIINIGYLPKEYIPTNDSYGVCVIVTGDGQYTQGTVKLSKVDGGIYVNAGTNKKTIKQVVIDMNYKF